MHLMKGLTRLLLMSLAVSIWWFWFYPNFVDVFFTAPVLESPTWKILFGYYQVIVTLIAMLIFSRLSTDWIFLLLTKITAMKKSQGSATRVVTTSGHQKTIDHDLKIDQPTAARRSTNKAFDRRKYRKQGRAAFNSGLPQWSCQYAERSEAHSGWHMGYESAKVDAQLGIKAHGISRDEWERRFKARIAEQLDLASEDDPSWTMAPATELTSWPEQDDYPVAGLHPEWTTKAPEAAADENLCYWTH